MRPTQTKIEAEAQDGMEISLPESTILVRDGNWTEFAAFKKKADPERPGNAIFILKPAVASWDRLVSAADNKPTGAFQLKVGDFVIHTQTWDEQKATHWLPVIVEALNEKLVNQPI